VSSQANRRQSIIINHNNNNNNQTASCSSSSFPSSSALDGTFTLKSSHGQLPKLLVVVLLVES
jgi:hypothetical protein